MSNISDASGYLTISANDAKAVKSVFKVVRKILEIDDDFATDFYDESSLRIEKETPWTYEGGIGFSASGRWTYQSDIESFGELAKERFEDELSGIEDFYFRLEFSYIDFEQGCEVFYEATDVLEHEEGAPIYQCKYTNTSYENIDMSVYNYMERFGLDVRDALETFTPNAFEHDSFDEFDAERIESFLDDIEKYYIEKADSLEALKWLRNEVGDLVVENLLFYWEENNFYYYGFGDSIEDFFYLNSDEEIKSLKVESLASNGSSTLEEVLGGVFEYSDEYLSLPFFEINELLKEAEYGALDYSEYKKTRKSSILQKLDDEK